MWKLADFCNSWKLVPNGSDRVGFRLQSYILILGRVGLGQVTSTDLYHWERSTEIKHHFMYGNAWHSEDSHSINNLKYMVLSSYRP